MLAGFDRFRPKGFAFNMKALKRVVPLTRGQRHSQSPLTLARIWPSRSSSET
jgi:hypothetical protein